MTSKEHYSWCHVSVRLLEYRLDPSLPLYCRFSGKPEQGEAPAFYAITNNMIIAKRAIKTCSSRTE